MTMTVLRCRIGFLFRNRFQLNKNDGKHGDVNYAPNKNDGKHGDVNYATKNKATGQRRCLYKEGKAEGFSTIRLYETISRILRPVKTKST